jgi:tetratricopeptide (TPR) repeat protein
VHGYFDALCASKESQLYGAPVTVADNAAVRGLRLALKDDPGDGELYLQLGDALAFQLRYLEAIEAYTAAIEKLPEGPTGYRKRGGRYLTTLQLARAYADYARCLSYGQDAQAELLSGLCAYMMGDYARAKAHFASWIALFGDDTHELVAVIYWYALCCVKEHDRAGMNAALSRYGADMDVGHHTAYQCGIRLLLEEITPEEALRTAEAAQGEDHDLEYSMIVYAVAQYAYLHGDTQGYIKALDGILARDTFWAGFASLAALNERYPEVAQNAERRGGAAARR